MSTDRVAAQTTLSIDLSADERDVVVNALLDYVELKRDQADDYEHQNRASEADACTADAVTAAALIDRLEA